MTTDPYLGRARPAPTCHCRRPLVDHLDLDQDGDPRCIRCGRTARPAADPRAHAGPGGTSLSQAERTPDTSLLSAKNSAAESLSPPIRGGGRV